MQKWPRDRLVFLVARAGLHRLHHIADSKAHSSLGAQSIRPHALGFEQQRVARREQEGLGVRGPATVHPSRLALLAHQLGAGPFAQALSEESIGGHLAVPGAVVEEEHALLLGWVISKMVMAWPSCVCTSSLVQ